MNKRAILPLISLRDVVLFPHMVIPLFVGRGKSLNALENAMATGKRAVLCAQMDARIPEPDEGDLHRIGTIGKILQLVRLSNGNVKVLVEGEKRARIHRYLGEGKFPRTEVEEIEEDQGVTVEVEALMRSTVRALEVYLKLHGSMAIREPSQLADTVAAEVELRLDDKQVLLEAEKVEERLELLCELIQSEIEILRVERKIRSRIKKQMEKSQKEHYLSEQMRAIQKELGEKDEIIDEMKDLEARIKRKRMSKEASGRLAREFKKLRMMPPMSAEATVIRNYIDWILSLPWLLCTKEKLDLGEAERILDEDHRGLEEVKERILEYLAVQGLVNRMKGPILCFVGPPGVGKTSLAKSIARATGRNFVRLSLGGVRDEAEIRGHRRTYVGAMPGKIVHCIRKAGSNNPVFLLDEVDKMSMDFRGDPAAALLEVLDPEQNHTFNDHYLDVDYDLSRVMFITTANSLHSIPPALEDRMETIRIAGYTELEKLQIAKRFLVPKQMKANGLTPRGIRLSDGALRGIIQHYTREAGVRNLEREIASICRKVAKEVVKRGAETAVSVTTRNLQRYLGVPKFRYGKREEGDQVGLANGLAWTETGGELLATEVTVMPGRGKLLITGKLGDVMRESAQAAMSYVRSRAGRLGLEKDFYQTVDIHIHVPEGAIPKDGP
jgi:ATP-dependent Lon protease